MRKLFLTLVILAVPLAAAAQVVNTEPVNDCRKPAAVPIVSAVRHTGIVYVTLASNHCAAPGDRIVITGVADKSFDGKFVVREAPTRLSLSYAQPGPDRSHSSSPPTAEGTLTKRQRNVFVRALARLHLKET